MIKFPCEDKTGYRHDEYIVGLCFDGQRIKNIWPGKLFTVPKSVSKDFYITVGSTGEQIAMSPGDAILNNGSEIEIVRNNG